MAGTRGIPKFRGEQFNNKIMRNNHFDEANKIDEKFVGINFHSHREALQDTKIDVFVQKNGQAVAAGVNTVEVTADILNKAIAVDTSTEGIILGAIVEMRKQGTADFPFIDADGDRVYAKIRQVPAGVDPVANPEKFFLDFFSEVAGAEAPYTFAGAENVDYKYPTRTNLSVIPVDAITSGGAGLVADAVDAEAYMNLRQLLADIYTTGAFDNDGNANLATPLQTQIANEVQARTDADTAIRNDLAATTGAGIVGVATNVNYTGLTVQEVLSNLAQRLKSSENLTDGVSTREANSANGYFTAGDFSTAEGRIIDAETKTDAALANHETRITHVETEDEEEVYEATGGEAGYNLVNGIARDKTVLLFLNGQALAPGINFVYKRNVSNQITGFDFTPDTLKITDGVPDVLLVKYKKVF